MVADPSHSQLVHHPVLVLQLAYIIPEAIAGLLRVRPIQVHVRPPGVLAVLKVSRHAAPTAVVAGGVLRLKAVLLPETVLELLLQLPVDGLVQWGWVMIVGVVVCGLGPELFEDRSTDEATVGVDVDSGRHR